MHDNLDPHSLGKTPSECGLDRASTWEAISSDVVEKAREQFQCALLEQLLCGCDPPRKVVDALISHSQEATKRVRDFMESNPRARQPADLRLYPGKMDHATCVAVVVKWCQSRRLILLLHHHRKERLSTLLLMR